MNNDEKEIKSTDLIFHSWGHNIHNKTGAIQDLVALIKHYLSSPQPNMAAVTDKLDMIAKISSEIANAPLPFILERININSLIQERIKRYGSFAHYKDIKFNVEFEGDAYVTANPVWLAEVLDELIQNASEALKNLENKEIAIATQMTVDKVTIFVKDNGNGIDRVFLSNIMKDRPTFRADGTGRGLYIVRLIIEYYGGEIKVDASSNGTKIAICLPRADVSEQE